MKRSRWFGLGLVAVLAAVPVTGSLADDVEIVSVESNKTGDGTWRFSVTLRHGDTGWDHYANLWQVESPDGTVLGERVLAHPHVNEQPFTRSLGGVKIPAGLEEVVIRARDSVHGFGPTKTHRLAGQS